MEKIDLKLYNTLSRSKEVFVATHPPKVELYTCGPTVYNYAHIGNLRTFLFEDVLRRVLEYNGYHVEHVMNITDVGHMTTDEDAGEDKMEVASKREQKDPWKIANFYIAAFLKHIKLLHILPANEYPRATNTVPEMLVFIHELANKGYAYTTQQGVYFNVQKFADYGKLSGKKLDDQVRNRDDVVVDPGKKHPADFALWKLNQPNHIMQWDSEWGRGFPGWHIECSVMSMKFFGSTIDIHTGGEDHIAVHHENEIAQSEALTGKKFVNYWLHAAFLQVDGGKMGKSLVNFFTLDQLMEKGYNPLAFRYFVLGSSYRTKLNFTFTALDAAQTALNKLQDVAVALKKESHDNVPDVETMSAYKQKFIASVNDDLNTPKGLALVWQVVKSDMNAATKYALLLDFDTVLGLGLKTLDAADVNFTPDILALVDERMRARENNDYKLSDTLREKLLEMGVEVLDTPHGQQLRKANI